jgi:hypothetical protein
MKLSDNEFLTILRENAGIYARTARAINKAYPGMKFTRQAVRQRAETFKDDLLDIQEENIDVAEEGLHSLMRSNNQSIKLKAINLFLQAKGRVRGYGDRMDLTSGDKPLVPFNGIIPVVRATDNSDASN